MIALTDGKGPSPLPDITEAEMFVFLAITNRWDIVYGTNSKTAGQQLAVSYTSQTTGVNLTGWTKILTDWKIQNLLKF
jgi:hypothetical protein